MGLRALVTLIISAIGIIGTFFSAFIGLITYAFWSYTYPERITWGLLPVGRLSYVVGACLVISTFIQNGFLVSRNWKNIFIILFLIICWASVLSVTGNTDAPFQFQYFTRVILITLLIPVLIDSKEKIKYYIWAIALFIGFIAAQSGIRGTLAGQVGGAASGLGGPIDDRNFYAVILCVVIPITFYFGNIENNKWLKLLLRLILMGSILALILTYARAGFLGLTAVILSMFMKTRRKFLAGLFGALLLIIFVIYFLPSEYKERVTTMRKVDITKEDVDMSAVSRLIAWRSALEMIKEHPLTGVGFDNSDVVIEKYPDPKTGIALQGRAIHNTILQIGAEIGLPALFIYMLLFFSSYRSLNKIKNMVRSNDLSEEFLDYASMFQVAFVGFFVSAFFVNAAFLDVPWHLIGLATALEQITKKESELIKI